MRFNKQELATLAQQPSNKFEKEGILHITERQDGFFRKTEGTYTHICVDYISFVYFAAVISRDKNTIYYHHYLGQQNFA